MGQRVDYLISIFNFISSKGETNVSLFNRKQESDFDGQQKDSPGKSKVSLLILLILVGGFGYLYFFTSLIVPHEVPSPPPATVPEVKKSMPPKPGDQPAAPAPAAADATKAEAAKPATPPAPAPKPAAAPAAPAKPAPAVAPAQPQAAAKPAPAAPAPAPGKKEAPPAVKKEEAAAVKPAPAKPAAAPAAKKEEPKAASPAAEKPAVKKKAVTYAIAVGDFPAGEEAAAAEAKLAKLKIKQVRNQALKKSRKMTRLFLGAYTDYDAYTTALEKLKQSAKGAFGVEKNGKYSIYAASFSSAAGAEKEKKLLQAKGVSVQLQQVVLPLSSVKITAGHFAAKGDADKAAARLKAEGIAVKVIPAGK